MIFFFADDHFGKHPGKNIFDRFPDERKRRTLFTENEWDTLEKGEWVRDCELLILHMIGETCGQPHAGVGAEKAVRAYCEKGGNLLLLHGSSAAFWRWDWWRQICGLRWVRDNDPDGVPRSTHPVEPFHLNVAKSRHILAKRLHDFELPKDEIYTALEQTNPVDILMTTSVNGVTWPQLFENFTPWGGKAVTFLPGHAPEVTALPEISETVGIVIDYLLKG